MTSIRSLFETNPIVETKGVEYPIVDSVGHPSGIFLQLARAGGSNKRFDLAKETAYRNWRAKNGKSAVISDDQHVDILIPVFAETVVIGWFFEDPLSKDPEQIPTIPFDDKDERSYTPQNAELLLRALPKSRLMELMEMSADFTAYRMDLGELAKNSKTS